MSLDTDQIETLKEAFGMFDKDGNGAISKDELMAVMTNLGLKPTEQEVKDIINEFDIDKSEHIEFDEFCHFMARQMSEARNLTQEEASDELLCAFRAFDKDGSGKISKTELETVMKNLGEELTEDEIEAMIFEADTDGDGEINYIEFTNMMMKKA